MFVDELEIGPMDCYEKSYLTEGRTTHVGRATSIQDCVEYVKTKEPAANGAQFHFIKVSEFGGGSCWAGFGTTVISHDEWQACVFRKGNN